MRKSQITKYWWKLIIRLRNLMTQIIIFEIWWQTINKRMQILSLTSDKNHEKTQKKWPRYRSLVKIEKPNGFLELN